MPPLFEQGGASARVQLHLIVIIRSQIIVFQKNATSVTVEEIDDDDTDDDDEVEEIKIETVVVVVEICCLWTFYLWDLSN